MRLESLREKVRKADLALSALSSSGGLLQPANAQAFMEIAIEEAKIMRIAASEGAVIPMEAPTQVIDKMRFASRILRKAGSGTSLLVGDRSQPNLGKVTLTTTEFKAQVNLLTSILQDNLEGERFKETVLRKMAERAALDMEELIVQGDTVSGADDFLKSFNGMIAGATSNVVNAGTVNLSKGILKQVQKAMPNEFLRDKSKLKFFTSLDAEADYIDALADRQTAEAERVLREGGGAKYGGSEVVGIPKFPENPTNVIYTDPANLVVGIWQDILLELDKNIEAGVVMLVATLRFTYAYAEETAAVKATNVKTTG